MVEPPPPWETRCIDRRTLLQRAATFGVGSLATAFFASCNTASPNTSTVTLTLWDYWKDVGTGYLGFFDEYTKLYPRITFQRTTIPFADFDQRLILASQARKLPDMLVLDSTDQPSFASKVLL